MRDNECVGFLQWALPQLHMRWTGFRKVRAQVCKRIHRRIAQLALEDVEAYQNYLTANPAEWQLLDQFCRVSISRFYRDKMVFAFLQQDVLPELAENAISRGESTLEVLSLGCGSGEEPYTLAIIWQLHLQQRYPGLKLNVTAIDADPNMKQRAVKACYQYGSIKNLPPAWQGKVFTKQGDLYCLEPEYRADIEFRLGDVREKIPPGKYSLVLCRNLVFTYFDEGLQTDILARIQSVLTDDGILVIGVHENLPGSGSAFQPWSAKLGIYRYVGANS